MERSIWTGGHTVCAFSLDINKDGVLASGGEDELCIWSKDGTPQTKFSLQNVDSKEVNSVCFCCKYRERLFASSGNKIFYYDIRNMKSALCQFHFNEEEINQIAVHDKGKFLAACDDSGKVKVIDVESNKLFTSLSSKHENICSTVQFRPSRPWEVVTGGLDSKIVSWDFSSGRALQEMDTHYLDTDTDSGESSEAYLINPPFVHSIHMASNGRVFAGGLGGGSVQLFHFEGKKKFVPMGCSNRHNSSVSQVHFPRFNSNGLLISGGNDCKLICWSMCSSSGTSNGASAEKSEHNADNYTLATVHEVLLVSKPNWITSSYDGRNIIFVADQTSDISVYQIK